MGVPVIGLSVRDVTFARLKRSLLTKEHTVLACAGGVLSRGLEDSSRSIRHLCLAGS